MYRSEAVSLGGFIQQISVCYVNRGYYFYVPGHIPEDKSPTDIDTKLIDKYRIDISKAYRSKRKKKGLSNVHYIRFKSDFFLFATTGENEIFEDEKDVICDIRKQPLVFSDYDIRLRDDKLRVSIYYPTWHKLSHYFHSIALTTTAKELEKQIYFLPFEPYKGVRSQLLTMVEELNHRRRKASMNPIRKTKAVRFKQFIYRPFDKESPVFYRNNK